MGNRDVNYSQWGAPFPECFDCERGKQIKAGKFPRGWTFKTPKEKEIIMHQVNPCSNCGREMKIKGGGLCGGCYSAAKGLDGEEKEKELLLARERFQTLKQPETSEEKSPQWSIKPQKYIDWFYSGCDRINELEATLKLRDQSLIELEIELRKALEAQEQIPTESASGVTVENLHSEMRLYGDDTVIKFETWAGDEMRWEEVKITEIVKKYSTGEVIIRF